MTLRFQKWITRANLRASPETLFVFGDNEFRYGLGGQAREMRGEPNAVGVATLSQPGRYWSEADAARQCAVVDRDLEQVIAHLNSGGEVVWPLDGIGTGLAQLPEHSPTTHQHINKRLAEMQAIGEQP